MQPYFFPYLGYFSLIKHTDMFVVLSQTQYMKPSWLARNRILDSRGGWMYFHVQVKKHHYNDIIKDVKVNNDVNWREVIYGQLTYYKRAPYYDTVMKLIKDVLSVDYDSIADLNVATLKAVCEYLRIDTPIKRLEELNIDLPDGLVTYEWGIEICKRIEGVNEFWNPPGGKSFFNLERFGANGLSVKFQEMDLPPYKQYKGEFEKGLSIIDVMMFNSVDNIHRMLDQYHFV